MYDLSTVTSLSRSGNEQNSELAGLARLARDRIQQALRALSQTGTREDRVLHQIDEPELRRVGNAQEQKILVARDKIANAWKGLLLSGREALSEGVPEFKWWDFGHEELDSAANRGAAVISEAIMRAYGPRLSSGAVPGGRRAGANRPPSVAMRRLLDVVERRQIFLHSASSKLESTTGETKDVKEVLQDEIDKMSRALPKKPNETTWTEVSWRYATPVSSTFFLLLP